jgi:hypothetical protein
MPDNVYVSIYIIKCHFQHLPEEHPTKLHFHASGYPSLAHRFFLSSQETVFEQCSNSKCTLIYRPVCYDYWTAYTHKWAQIHTTSPIPLPLCSSGFPNTWSHYCILYMREWLMLTALTFITWQSLLFGFWKSWDDFRDRTQHHLNSINSYTSPNTPHTLAHGSMAGWGTMLQDRR